MASGKFFLPKAEQYILKLRTREARKNAVRALIQAITIDPAWKADQVSPQPPKVPSPQEICNANSVDIQ